MRLPGALKYLSFGMVLLGSLTLLLVLKEVQLVNADLIFLVVVVFSGSLFVWESRIHTRAYLAGWNLLTIGYVLYLFANFWSRNLIVSAAYLSVFLQLYKCYNKKTNKDYVQMYLISFFQFISCTGITSSPLFIANFSLFIVLSLWTLIAFHMKRQLEKYSVAQYSDKEGSRYLVAGGLMDPEDIEEVNLFRNQALKGVMSAGFLGGTFVLALVVLLAGLMLFYILPRPSQAGPPGFFEDLELQLSLGSKTGLSEQIDISHGGTIYEDSTIVMKIKPLRRQGGPTTALWRAGSLNAYVGGKWINTVGPADIYRANEHGVYGLSHRYRGSDTDTTQLIAEQDMQAYQVMVEISALDRVMSGVSTPVAVADAQFRFPIVEEGLGTGTYRFRFSSAPPSRYSYKVFSPVVRPSDDALRAGLTYEDLSGPMRILYVRDRDVPASVDNALIDAGVFDQDNNLDKIRAIQRYLERNYTYTLDIRRTPGVESPIDDFLEHTRSGHCELFASAMALMCKRAGIPTRIVQGYKSNEWNEYGEFYQVRQKDAHAWVEVYYPPGREWIPFDPSPSLAANQPKVGFFKRFFGSMGRFAEAVRTQWYDSVIFYNRSKQKEFALSLIDKIVVLWLRVQGFFYNVKYVLLSIWMWFSGSKVTATIAIISITSVVSAGVLLVARKLRARWRFRDSYQQGIARKYQHRVRFYERMLKTLMGIGIIKPENMTPAEFAEDIESRGLGLSGIRRITRVYYSVRFGGSSARPDELDEIEIILKDLRKAVFLKR